MPVPSLVGVCSSLFSKHAATEIAYSLHLLLPGLGLPVSPAQQSSTGQTGTKKDKCGRFRDRSGGGVIQVIHVEEPGVEWLQQLEV